jgi:putative flippase GtrA
MAAFSLVGVVNTIVGFSIIFIATTLGASPIWANVFGYGAGLCVSFVLNSRVTFQRRRTGRSTLLRFLCAFAIAFAANITLVWVITHVFALRGPLASLAGAPAFTVIFYVLSECWVFRHAATGTSGQPL